MKIAVFIFAMLMLAPVAKADALSCRLTSNSIKTEVTVDRPALHASVTQRPFKCEGEIDGYGMLWVTISSTEVEDSKFASGHPMGNLAVELTSLNVAHGAYDTGRCECWLQ